MPWGLAFGAGTLPTFLAADLVAGRMRIALRREGVRAGALIMALGPGGLACIPGPADSIRGGPACLT